MYFDRGYTPTFITTRWFNQQERGQLISLRPRRTLCGMKRGPVGFKYRAIDQPPYLRIVMSATHDENNFLCELCGDQFGRLEHLNRHTLSHTDIRPFRCSQCTKRFARKDTLNRHEAVHSQTSTVVRSTQACRACAKLKVRCDARHPCSRCHRRAAHCVYPPRSSRLRIPSAARINEDSAMLDTGPDLQATSACDFHNPDSVHVEDSFAPDLGQELDLAPPDDFDFVPWEGSGIANFNNFDWITWGTSTPTGPLLDVQTPVATATDFPNTPPTTSENTDALFEVAGFPMDWDPKAAEHRVSFPHPETICTDFVDVENLGHVGSITLDQYNRINQCLVTYSDSFHTPQSLSPVHSARLPPIEVMNSFLQLYFEHFQPIFPMLHRPTFNVGASPWPLVLAIAAMGCRYSKAVVPGFERTWPDAFQELLRRALSETVWLISDYPSSCH